MRRRPFLGLGLLVPGSRPLSPGAMAAPAATAIPAAEGQAQAPRAPQSTQAPPSPPPGVTRRALRFPADHAAHPDTHIEWWYVTGWLRGAPAGLAARDGSPKADPPPEFGFQVTFFRTRTGLAEDSASRFAARQIVFAHVALTDLAASRNGGAAMMHDQRIARTGFGLVETPGPTGTQVVRLRDWSLSRSAPSSAPSSAAPSTPTPTLTPTAASATELRIAVRSERFGFDFALRGTQPVLLQGDAGYSRKGPRPEQASLYYSEPQLLVDGRLERAGLPAREVTGRAWLDHEWSDELLPAEAVGWDWVGFNLLDGGTLMAFRLRRPDGTPVWAGGSFRDAAGRLRIFGAGEVAFSPQRRWQSPRTRASYPVEWTLQTPVGPFRVRALQDDQELDSRGSTGSVYWEGVCALQRLDGQTLGWGYLELTGYLDRLRV